MDYKDYYKVLGVNKGATDKEIKSAFRKLARKHHPDVNPGDKAAETRFKEINEAYEVLSDPEKRKRYDELGSNWQNFQQRTPPSGQPFDWGQYGGSTGGPTGRTRTMSEDELRDMFGDNESFSDFFRTFFGGVGKRAGGAGTRFRTAVTKKGENIEEIVDITLEEAYNGASRVFEITGEKTAPRRVEAKLPAGVTEGTRVRLAGQGGPGVAGGPPGDLILRVHILPHPRFERNDNDITTKVSVPLTTAMLGGEVEVPTVTGRLMLRIPPETQNGKKFRLRGKGMPLQGNTTSHGDLYAEVEVLLPTKLTTREKEIFEELARLRGAEAYAPAS